jgi:hypothetical protein
MNKHEKPRDERTWVKTPTELYRIALVEKELRIEIFASHAIGDELDFGRGHVDGCEADGVVYGAVIVGSVGSVGGIDVGTVFALVGRRRGRGRGSKAKAMVIGVLQRDGSRKNVSLLSCDMVYEREGRDTEGLGACDESGGGKAGFEEVLGDPLSAMCCGDRTML